ncbi:MAG: hypothetical protein GF411_12715 [Candidatus Lokiarchaeota archaeon]|nr:hypothetical protein [Candidatus Lokiarchaeota archaeon]
MNEQTRISPKARTCAVVLFLIIALYAPSVVLIQSQALNNSKFQASTELDYIVNKFETNLTYLFSLVESLHLSSISHENYSDLALHFNTTAPSLYNRSEHIRVITVAPNGTQLYVYPLEGNEGVLGHNLLEDDNPSVVADVQLALETDDIVVSVPYELRQGGIGIVGRKSVFVNSTWWGFVTIIVDFVDIIEESLLSVVESSYYTCLKDKNGQLVAGTNDIFLEDSLVFSFNIFNQPFSIAFYPIRGWLDYVLPSIVLSHIGILTIVFLTTGISWLTFNKQEELTVLVDKRTEELERANIGLKKEIEDRKRIEENLRAQKEELSQFAHTLSHDLKGRFHNILGYAELLEDEYDQKYVDRISQQVKRMQLIVEKSVELADAGLVIDEKKKYSLRSLVLQVKEIISLGEVELVVQDLPSVYCDGPRLIQALQNIIDNAIIHGNADTITIFSEPKQEHVDLIIENDGKTIPPDILPQIFERGFSTKKGHQGIGLVIIHKIIQAHGWRITIESEDILVYRISIPNSDIAS